MTDLNTLIWTCIRFNGLDGLDFAKSQCKNGVISDEDYKVVEAFYYGLNIGQYSTFESKGNRRMATVFLPSFCRLHILYSQIGRMALAMTGEIIHRETNYNRSQVLSRTRIKRNFNKILRNDNADKYMNFCISHKDLL